MTQPIHILSQLGVMVSFSVAKRITESDLQKYVEKYKKSGMSEDEIADLLHEKAMKEIQLAVDKNEVPGLVSSDELAMSMGINSEIVKQIPELNKLVMVIIHKLMDKKFDKMSLCYFVNSLVNLLELEEDDFTEFHKKNGIPNKEDDSQDFFDDSDDEEPDDGDGGGEELGF